MRAQATLFGAPQAAWGSKASKSTPRSRLAPAKANQQSLDRLHSSLDGFLESLKPDRTASRGLDPPRSSATVSSAQSYVNSLESAPSVEPAYRLGTSTDPFLNGMVPHRQVVEKAYGVEQSLRMEEKLHSLQRQVNGRTPGMPPSGWRRSNELEDKLKRALEGCAASKLQLGLLREDSRRKGRRIVQLEAMLSELEKDYRAARLRLSEGGAEHEPLPPFAAAAVDSAVGAAQSASRQLLGAGMGELRRRPGGGGAPHAVVGAPRRASHDGHLLADSDDDDLVIGVLGSSDGSAGHKLAGHSGGAADVAAWSAELWARSLGVDALVAAAVCRHLHATDSVLAAELPFVTALGDVQVSLRF